MKIHLIDNTASESIIEVELPLKIGVDLSSDIRVNAPISKGIILLIDQLDGRLFLQKINKNEQVLFNENPLIKNHFIQNGDKVNVRDKSIIFNINKSKIELLVTTEESSQYTQFELNKKQSIFNNKILRRLSLFFTIGLLYFLTYLFSANAIKIEVTPINAEVNIKGGFFPHFKVGERFLITNGNHDIAISSSGYFPLVEEIMIDGDLLEHKYELEKLPGKLFIKTTPDAQITLFNNEKIIEKTDEKYYLLDAGVSSIKINSDRFFPIDSDVLIEGMNKEQVLEFTLKQAWSNLKLTSFPSSAEVIIDNNLVGRTPGIFEVIEGSRLLNIEKDGFKTFTKVLEINATKDIELKEINLIRLDSKIKIITKPEKASMNINSIYQGLSPLELDLEPLVEHSLDISKPGYRSVNHKFKLPIIEEIILKNKKDYLIFEKSLEPIFGQIDIVGSEETKVIINNKIQGLIPMKIDLLAVDQELTFEKEGYVSQIKTIKPTPGFNQTLTIDMLTPKQDVLARLPKVIQTSQGLKMALVKPGIMTLGSPRRTQGRRSNETERLVEITKPFYVGIREIINNEFLAFKPEHRSGGELYKELSNGLHPTVMVSWEDAVAYCNWLSEKESLEPAYLIKDEKFELIRPITNGYRLLSEAEWEWVARYNGGGGAQKYPWGANMPPEEDSGNFAGESTELLVNNYMADYFDGYPFTSPPKKFKPNKIGVFDLGGNVAEWVNDYYTVLPKNIINAEKDPFGPFIGNTKVIKGSSWKDSTISELRYSYRDYASLPRIDVGFRIARYNTLDSID